MLGNLCYLGFESYDKLVSEIIKLAHKYASETVSLPNNSGDLYDYVRNIPYVPEKKQVLKEPYITAKEGGVCTDKTILIAAWALCRGIPCRVTLAGVKSEPGIYHHIFPELFINGKWVTYDATYSYQTIDTRLPVYDVFKTFSV